MAVSGVSSQQSANGASSSSNPMASASAGLDTTFLNLLTAELKAQDPTAPMDGNQMVSQMVALNQLDQLIAIRQILQAPISTSQTGDTASAPQGAN